MKPPVSPWRWARAWALGASAVALSAGGHMLGGGHMEPVLLALLVALASLAAYIGIAVTIEKDGTKQGFHDKFAGGTRVVKS